MAGDRALAMLIDIKARNSFSGVIGLLASSFSGLMGSLGNLAFGFRNLGTAGTIGMDALKLGAVGLLKSLLQIAAVLGFVAIAAGIALGVAAVKAAGDFQQGLQRLVTGAGDVTDNMTKMGQAILGVSIATGVAAGEELKAMYLIISAHQRGAQAINTLTVASEGAVIEQASVADVANVLSGVMTNYGTKVYNATQFMNGLIQAVKEGKITLQDLAVAMGPLDPIAQRLGISFNDMAAAMTTQTNAMIPAARAATALRFLMLGLENPTKKARDAMAHLGLSSVAVAEEMKKSLPGALQMIYDAAKRAGPEGSVPFNRAIGDMVGGVRGLTAFLALTGPHFQDFVNNSKKILAAMKAYKDEVIGWDLAQKNFNVKMDQAKAAFHALLIVIGTALLPVLSQLLDQVTPLIQKFIDWEVNTHGVEHALAAVQTAIQNVVNRGKSIIDFFKNNEIAMDALKGMLITLAGVIAVLVVGAFYAWAAAAWSAAAGMIALTWPVLAIIAAVAALVAGFIYLYNHSLAVRQAIDWLKNALASAWAYITTNFQPAVDSLWQSLQKLWNFIVANVVPVWDSFKQAMQRVWSYIVTNIVPIFVSLWNTLQKIWDIIVTKVKPEWDKFVAACVALWNVIQTQLIPALIQLWAFIQKNIVPIILTMWQIIQKNLLPVLLMLWDYVQNKLVPILQQLWISLKPLLPGLELLAAIVGGLLLVAILAILVVLTALVLAMAAVITVVSIVITTFIKLYTIIDTALKSAGKATGDFVAGVIGWFQGLSSKLVGHSIVPDMMNAIVALFTGLPGRALTAISSLGSRLAGFFAGLASQALSWGRNIITNLAAGIAAGIGAAVQAAMNVASAVARVLHHSTPDVGPLAGDDLWGLHFIDNLVMGMRMGIPALAAAAASVAATMGGGYTLGSTLYATQGGWSNTRPTGSWSSGSSSSITVIHVYPPNVTLDGESVVDKVMSRAATHVRRHGGPVRNR